MRSGSCYTLGEHVVADVYDNAEERAEEGDSGIEQHNAGGAGRLIYPAFNGRYNEHADGAEHVDNACDLALAHREEVGHDRNGHLEHTAGR